MLRLAEVRALVRFLWIAARGFRLRPWASPYLRWRIETYWGWPADSIGFRKFWALAWRRRSDWAGFLVWAARMTESARSTNPVAPAAIQTEHTLSS